MLFYRFRSQEERSAFGGAAMLELQYCRLHSANTLSDLVAVENIVHWQNDSLYVADELLFYQEYSHIFNCGVYNNLNSGTVDIYGINYYAPEQTERLLQRLRAEKPCGYEQLADWLEESRDFHGFYILGL